MTESVNNQLKLEKPVEHEGVTYEELKLREATIAELRSFNKTHGQKSGFEYDVPYFSMMCGVPQAVIDGLSQRDWKRLSMLHKRFLTVEGEDEDLLA